MESLSIPWLLLLFVFGCLAVFRVSEMWLVDKGPLHIFSNIRRASCKIPVICEMIKCFYCLATWAALLFTIWVWVFNDLPLWLAPVWWFAVTGGAAVIYRSVRER